MNLYPNLIVEAEPAPSKQHVPAPIYAKALEEKVAGSKDGLEEIAKGGPILEI